MGLVDGTVNCVPGGGAPFTIWSRLDIVRGLTGWDSCVSEIT